MKARSWLNLLCCVLLWSSSAVAFDPESVAVNPDLADFTAEFFPAQVFKVTNGVYVARGYNRDNPVLVQGPGGLVVIDPGESIDAAEVVKEAFVDYLGYDVFSKFPVKAIIYTHHHDCHIHGASVFAGKDTEIIAHKNLMEVLFADWYGQLFPSRLEGGAKMSGSLFADDPGWFAGGGLFAVQVKGDSGFLAPTRTVEDKLETTIAGVKMALYSVPGETRDVLVVWLEDKKTLVQIANLYQAMPAITTLRGAYPRNPLDYISSIDVYRSLNPEYLVLIHGPNPVLAGKDTINQTLTNYRDAIQFIHDQTVQNMNKGLTPGEIVEVVKLPDYLASDPFLQEYYGEVSRNIYEIFWWYRGYFSGKCRDLFAHSPMEEAETAKELAGGLEELASKANDALTAGKLERALVLADNVLLLDSGNAGARATKNQAMILLAEKTQNAQVRNYLLSEYLLETEQKTNPLLGHPKLAFYTIGDNILPMMPMDTIFRIMAVNLNTEKSLEEDVTVGLSLTDKQSSGTQAYTMHVRRVVFEVSSGLPSNGLFKIVTDSLTWKKLCLGKINPADAITDGDIKIEGGDTLAFSEFLNLFI